MGDGQRERMVSARYRCAFSQQQQQKPSSLSRSTSREKASDGEGEMQNIRIIPIKETSEEEKMKINMTFHGKAQGDYSLFRTIAERRKTKPERNMHRRVAITVTKVPLSGAECGPPLQAPHCHPKKEVNLTNPQDSRALLTTCQGGIRLRSVQGKCQRCVWVEHPSLPNSTWPSLIPDRECVYRLWKRKFRMRLIVCVGVPHNRGRISGDNAIRRTNRICVAVLAESRKRQVLGGDIEICEVPGEGNLVIWRYFEVGCRCLCWLCDRQTTGCRSLGDAKEGITQTFQMEFIPQCLTWLLTMTCLSGWPWRA